MHDNSLEGEGSKDFGSSEFIEEAAPGSFGSMRLQVFLCLVRKAGD